MSEPHYYKVRMVGTGTDEDPIRPDWPNTFAGPWCIAHNVGDDYCIAMTTEDVALGESRGSVVPIPDLPDAAQERGVPFDRVRDAMAIGGVGHPERAQH